MRALVLAAAFFAIAPAAQAATPRPQAALVSCDRVHHAAVFEGRMDARPGTRMQMRFTLQDREPGVHWTRVVLPGFSAWQSAAAGKTRFLYTKTIDGLVGPGGYRVVVRFRWVTAAGAVSRAMTRVSPTCHQPDPRADLSVTGLEVRPGLRAGRNRYAITVANSGRSAAPASHVALDLGTGAAPLTGAVGALDPGEEATVVIGGPACTPGTLLTAVADATDVVDEHDEDDDTFSLSCPASA